MISSANTAFVRYLLSIRSSKASLREAVNITPRQLDVSTAGRLYRAVHDFLANRLKEFLGSWKAISAERISNIGNDVVEIIAVASTVFSAIWTRCEGQELGSKQPSILSETRTLVADSCLTKTMRTLVEKWSIGSVLAS